MMNMMVLNNALLEILLHIGTSFELKTTINDALLHYLQQLDLAGIILFEEDRGRFIPHTSKPKVLKNDPKVLSLIDTFMKEDQSASSSSFPVIISQENSSYYIYELKGFGLLTFVIHAGSLTQEAIKALLPINQKFANSLIACKNIEKLREQDKQLLQQSRLAQMGEMISMIAHQWRQPLSTISSTVINIQAKMKMGKFDLTSSEGLTSCQDFLDDKLNNIDTYIQGLSTTIDDFRNFYNPHKERGLLTVNEPILKSLSIIKASMLSQGIEIEERYESKKVLSMADGELMQVFLNIFKNAQDNFKEKNSKNATILVKTFDLEEGVCVEISDNGGGIPQEISGKIFDPYFSTKSEKNGTGLGLYMSKTIIEEHHHGILEFENREDGVTFIVMIKDSDLFPKSSLT